jgi:hypothetical protein
MNWKTLKDNLMDEVVPHIKEAIPSSWAPERLIRSVSRELRHERNSVLGPVLFEWGDAGSTDVVGAEIGRLAPGASAFLWKDVDGNGAEVRMDMALRVRIAGAWHALGFEFPKLYRRRDSLPVVAAVGKPGYECQPNE